MFVGPHFTVELINNSPRIQGDTVSIDFNATYPLLSATCYLGREFVEDCEFNVWDYTVCDCWKITVITGTMGSVIFTKVPMGKSYIFRVEARGVDFRRVVIREQVHVFGNFLHHDK